ncbi:MAG TPA: hypothetical protein VM223_07840 [Planctomycetota bacterium]|nr:hypothetical protein [Planctomycetota bacterium]
MNPIRVIYYPGRADYRLVEQGGERFVQVCVSPGCNWVRYERWPIIAKTDAAAIKEFREWFRWKTGDPKRRGPEPALGPSYASEEEFLQDVRAQAHLFGWTTYHTRNSKGSDKGLLDLIMRRERLVWAELKMPGKQPTPEQVELMDWLKANGYEVYLWYPADMDEIAEVLTRKEYSVQQLEEDLVQRGQYDQRRFEDPEDL